LIADFKHKGHHFIGKGLSDTFCDAIRSHYQQQHLQLPDWVAPVPLHWWRQWQRGFNQSALFSEQISQQLGIEHFTHLKRIRATPAQKNLSREERLKNLQHCFKITRPLHGKSVAIIDDVMTTGATVNTLAKTLKQAGAGKIIVWALARTPIH
jgi:ComF family protein